MTADQYKAKLQEMRDRTVANLSELGRWGTSEALPWLWQELAGIVGKKKIRPMRSHNAIRQGLQTTLSARQKMPTLPPFYIAQLTMLDSEARRYCAAVASFTATSEPFSGNAALVNLHGGLIDLFRHGIILFEQAAHALLSLPTVYGGWRRRIEHPFEVFKGAEQIIYGQFSGLTHLDRAPFTPVSVLRTAIEIRLRSAFGVYGYLDPSNQNFRPINVSQLAEEIQKHLPALEFGVDFHDLMRVYRWSNPYLHSGWRDFIWVSGFTLQFLRPLFSGPAAVPGKDWSIHGGIRMPRETWRAIRHTFEKAGSDRHLDLNPAEETAATCVFLT